MVYKISINSILSIGLVLTPFLIGLPFNSLGWLMLGLKNEKHFWTISGIICFIASIYFFYFFILLIINASLTSFIQEILRNNVNDLYQRALDHPFFYFILIFIILQIFNMILFFIEFPSNTALSSIISSFIALFLIYYLNSLVIPIVTFTISLCLMSIAVSRVPEEILRGYIEKPNLSLE